MGNFPRKALDLSAVDSINNIDTARMSLRWALERLASLEGANAEAARRLAAEEELRRKTENDYAELKRVIVAQPKDPIPRKDFLERMQEYVTMALAGKLSLAAFAEREAKVAQSEGKIRMERAQLNDAMGDFEQRLQEDEIRRHQIEELSRRLDLSAAAAAGPIVEERISGLQTSWMEERQRLLDRISDLSAQLAQESHRKISALESLQVKKLKKIEERENVLRLHELKIKGAMDAVNVDIQRTMQETEDSKARADKEAERQRQALFLLNKKYSNLEKSAAAQSRAQRAEIQALGENLAAARGEAISLRAEVDQRVNENAELGQRLLELDAAFKELSGQNAEMSASLEELTAQNRAMRDALLERAEESAHEKAALHEALNKASARSAETESRLNEAQAAESAARAAAEAGASSLAQERERRRKLEEYVAERLDGRRPSSPG